ncbi:neuronal acetylcholine receptor subunit alpha-6 isoform X1 [Procambarus clarkii]|uniref:neuronal acetylcholine receptor subunit alpha-6 isoform X1 n=1 Tax=Procambarus clarkii TaxID=6728 RepID=UPI003743044E
MRTTGLPLFLGPLLVAVALTTPAGADTDWWSLNERVRKEVLKTYDKRTMPQRTHNGTTWVYFDFVLRGLWFDETSQVLHLNAWILMVWKDKRVRWDPKDYGGLDVLHFGHDELWTPDITVYNNADITEVDHYGNTHLVVYNGWVVWFPPAHISVECPMDISHWPYDTQTCHIYFGSWTTHGWQIELSYPNFTKPLTNRYNLKTSSHWHVNGGTLRRLDFWYEDVPEPYYTMHAEFTITRNSPSFVSTVVLPACVVSVATLVQFLLPVSHSKRVTVGCTAVLLTLLQLLYLAHAIPPLGTSIPIIVRFYGQTLVVVVTSLVVSGGLLRLTQGPHLAQPPPLSLKKLLTGPLANILFLHDYTEKVGLSGGGAEDGEVLEETRPASYLHEWLLVAAALDRLAAITFVAAFVITLIAYVAPV